jgi:hypothetical protein
METAYEPCRSGEWLRVYCRQCGYVIKLIDNLDI